MTPSSPPSYTFLDTQRSPLLTSLASKLPNPSTNIPHQTSIPTAPPITDPTQSPPHTGPNSPGPTFPTNQPTSHEPNNIQTQTQNNPLPPPIFDPPNPQTNTNPVNEPPRTHPMITRSQSGIVKPIERLSLHTSSLSPIPKSPFIALKDPNWCNAMYDEYNALVKNGTWILVPRPSDVNLVRSMWLFKHKFHADGTLSRYKARLVANGSNQQHGVDFDETFSPVVKPATIRTVLSLVVSRQWPIHQLDVKNAFLNGDLSETVYMHQPPGFVDSRYPNHVCLLQRSLYGLKQAPRAWFQRFAGYATRAGFSPSRCDSSLFIYTQGSQVAYLLIYVDDIILTASSPVLLQQIVDSLHKEFDMTDLGALNYFLGISAVRHPTGLFLSQNKYARQLLERAHMVNCNPSRTPINTNSKLGLDDVRVQDPTLYRSLVGGLQYLIFTRTDLSYAVQQVCLYMHDPREQHFTALKFGYTDADRAGCPFTRRSTSGYYMFLGNNLLSWSAKRQHTISRSSAKAKYQGVANVVAETAWIHNLLCELHSPLLTATLVYCDNVSTDIAKISRKQSKPDNHEHGNEKECTRDGIMLSKSCGNGAHIGYNCPPKAPIISKSEQCNQTINELPQILPSVHPTCNSGDDNSFTYDSKPNSINDSPNVFNPLPQPSMYSCEFCENDTRYGHYCTHQVPFIYPEPCYNQNYNFPQDFHNFQQQYLCCENCGGPHETFQCQPMNEDYYEQNSCYDPNSFGFDQFQPLQYTVNHPILNAQNEFLNSQNKLMEQMTSICDMVGQIMQKKEEERRIAEDQAAKDRYWKIPICYDDDEDYTIAITPVLSTKEAVDSLIMEDEHLDTISATESDEVIKSSVEILVPIPSEFKSISEDTCDVPVCEDPSTFDALSNHSEILSVSKNDSTSSDDDSYENIEYVEASPLNLEYDSLEELLNISRLVTNIESLKDNPTSDHVLKSPFSFPNPIVDSDSFFEKSDTSFSYSYNSLPKFETFSDHTEETRSGSTTTYANNSLPEYDSFLFEVELDQGGLISIVISDNSNDLLLELPEFESFHIDLAPSFPRPPPEPPDVEISLIIETDAPVINNFDELNEDECFDPGGDEIDVEDDDSFTFVIRTFLPFLTYPEVEYGVVLADGLFWVFGFECLCVVRVLVGLVGGGNLGLVNLGRGVREDLGLDSVVNWLEQLGFSFGAGCLWKD
ncbi:ribonuclease H-like domain-containing protein [Tanacetum coccineum]